MAKLSFEREQAVQKSLNLFWEKGYHDCSMQDLLSATGLKPGSLYHSFGNKHKLYLEALSTYADMSKNEINNTLGANHEVLSGIAVLLKKIVNEGNNRNYCGCFLIKTQLEFASLGGELYEFAQHELQQTETLYQQYLSSVYSSQESADKARSLMLHIFGVRIYSYSRSNTTTNLLRSLEQNLPWLPWA